jgi:hypothetical protein
MSRYIDRGTFEELLVVNPAEAERALDVIRPLLDEFRTVVPAADLYFIVSHDRQTFANRFEYADVGVERDGVLFLIRRTNSPSKGYTVSIRFTTYFLEVFENIWDKIWRN